MEKILFKQRIISVASSCATTYKKNFLDYDYLICSDSFKKQDFYIIRAYKDNFQHLVGVNSLISSTGFFDKCYNGTLLETDFDFEKEKIRKKV